MVHRSAKQFYQRTNKTDSFEGQIAKHERRQKHLQTGSYSTEEKLPLASPEEPYQMSKSRDRAIDIGKFLHNHYADPAVKVSLICPSWNYS